MKKKKKRGRTLIIIIVIVLAVLWLFDDEDDSSPGWEDSNSASGYTNYGFGTVSPDVNNDNNSTYDSSDTWAIYWYLCGSDLETYSACATVDLEEMMRVTLPDNVFVVIEAGGSEEWHNDFVDERYINRFLYSGNELKFIETQPSGNMGDRNTFESFLRFCAEKYPADHQAVILWNHGGGSVAGVAFDELYDFDSLSLADMRGAFEAVFKLSETNPPIELIGFDACLMATVDVAYTFRDIAKYLVAS